MVPTRVHRRPRRSWRGAVLAAVTASLLVGTAGAPAPAVTGGGAPPAAAAADLVEEFDAGLGAWFPVAGSWATDDGAAVSSSGFAGNQHRLALVDPLVQDPAAVTVDLRALGDAPATSWVGVQVMADGLGDSYPVSGYTLLIRRNGELALIKGTGGTAVEHLGAAATDARPDQGPVTLHLEVQEGVLRAGVDDQPALIEATDTEFSSGTVSVLGYRNQLAVDRVALTGTVEAPPLPEVGPDRGPVLVDDARVELIASRVDRGVQPQASAWQLLLDEVEQDVDRVPDPPTLYFVPFFYNDPDAHRAARDGLQNDANAAYRLALAYRVGGDTAYGEHAAAFLDAWATEVLALSTAEDSTLAFSYHFPAMVYAAELLRDTPVWSAEDEAVFASFLRHRALPMSSGPDATNNWASWGLTLTSSIAGYLDDEELLAASVQRARYLLDEATDEQGHLEEEVTRNNGVGDYGIWYSHFAAFPTTLAAETLALHGTDLWDHRTPDGVGLADVVREIAGWVDEPATFPYYDGDVDGLANVRTIDYLREDGYLAHAMSYLEIAANHADLPVVDQLLEQERPMTTIHSAPHLTLTHGCVPCTDLDAWPVDQVDLVGRVRPGGVVRAVIQLSEAATVERATVRVGEDEVPVRSHVVRDGAVQVTFRMPEADRAVRVDLWDDVGVVRASVPIGG